MLHVRHSAVNKKFVVDAALAVLRVFVVFIRVGRWSINLKLT